MNLVEILKNCPKGTKLYTPIWGEVTFIEVVENGNSLYPILIFDSINNYIYLTKDGHYLLNRKDSECIIFPSKDQRDWSKFTAPWYKKEMSTIAWIEKQGEQEEPQVYETEDGKIITYSETDGYKFDEPNFHENERAWLYLVSDVLTWKDGIGQYLDDPGVQELSKRLCSEYAQKLYNPSNTEKDKQKSTNKIEPKFKVGDWIASNLSNSSNLLCIIGVDETNYEVVTSQGSTGVPFIRYIDKHYHLWTIQDAKDGDVLTNDHHILILKELVYDWSSNGTPYSVKAYCGIKPNGNFEIGKDNWCFCGTLHIFPAAKEQRDALMKAMNDAGYEWDAKKKELNKKKKFDPKTLKPFDKVLVYDICEGWACALFSHIRESEYPYSTSSGSFKVCIPYNDDTKHLLGTKEEAPEYYRY